MADAGILCFNRDEQRQISLALGLRIGALNRLAATDLPPSHRASIHGHLAECERLVRVIADGTSTA